LILIDFHGLMIRNPKDSILIQEEEDFSSLVCSVCGYQFTTRWSKDDHVLKKHMSKFIVPLKKLHTFCSEKK